jgi:hypothetical protein
MMQARKASTASSSGPATYKDVCLKTWSSDAGAYPIIGILTFAVTFCAWKIGHASTCQDVRFTPTARQTLIRPKE